MNEINIKLSATSSSLKADLFSQLNQEFDKFLNQKNVTKDMLIHYPDLVVWFYNKDC